MTQPDRSTIRDALRANMHDGDEGGRLTMSVKDLLDESTEIIREFVMDDDLRELIKKGKHREAVWLMVLRLGACEWDLGTEDVQVFRGGERLCLQCRNAVARDEIVSAAAGT